MRVLALCSMLLLGCATRAPREHIVMFDHDGAPLDPGKTGWFGAALSGYARLGENRGADEQTSEWDHYVGSDCCDYDGLHL